MSRYKPFRTIHKVKNVRVKSLLNYIRELDVNIHFDDKELFEDLMDSALDVIEFGSNLYDCKTDSSDTDILVIYADSKDQSNSLFSNHHQLQYKTEDTDYVFVTLEQYIKNIWSGDQTVLYETLPYLNTDLSWMNKTNYMFLFANQTTLKAYLGFAKRDIETVLKITQNDKNSITNKTIQKKLHHAFRGYLEGVKLTKFCVDNSYVSTVDNLFMNCIEFKELLKIKTGEHELYNSLDSLKEFAETLKTDIKNLRKFTTDNFKDYSEGWKYTLSSFDNDYINFINSEVYTKKQKDKDFKNIIIDSFVDGVTY